MDYGGPCGFTRLSMVMVERLAPYRTFCFALAAADCSTIKPILCERIREERVEYYAGLRIAHNAFAEGRYNLDPPHNYLSKLMEKCKGA
jgi:hypothetical protein